MQVHVGLVVRVEASDVAPVATLVLGLTGDDVGREVVHVGDAGAGEHGDHVAADVGRDVVAPRRADDVDQRLRVEDVVAHRCQRTRRVARHRRRVGRLLVEGDDLAGVGRLR